MNILVNRAEELRQALLYLESRPGKTGDRADIPVAAAAPVQAQPAMERRPRPMPENGEAYQNGNSKRARLEQMARAERKQRRSQGHPQAPEQQAAVTEVTEEHLMANQHQGMQAMPDVFARQNQKFDEDENIW